MGGVEYVKLLDPDKATALKAAIEEYWLWLRTVHYNTEHPINPNGIIPTWIDPEDLTDPPSEALTHLMSENEIKAVQNGKTWFWWICIQWLWRWDEPEIGQFIYACKKHDCTWFAEEIISLIETSERDFIGELKKALPPNLKMYGLGQNEINEEWL